jgi:O-antigen/teichoic acid export membrane protein
MSKNQESLPDSKQDIAGKDRFIWNVITSWLGYLFVLIPGFILPRLVSDIEGDFSLGVWDFCWAFVNYLKLSNFGIGASVSRFVAKYNTEGSVEGLNGTVSTIFFFQLVVGTFVLIATIVLALSLPYIYQEKLASLASDVHLVIFFLGGSLALYFYIDVFRGVTTGVHRWDVHNAIIASTHAFMFITMSATLYFGGGLIGMSIAYFAVSVASEIVRVLMAYKICPQLKISRAYASWKRGKKMASFGAKTVLSSLPQVVIIQSVNVLVMGALGPVMLAILMRPIALLRHTVTFINRFSFVLTPMAGSLQASDDMEEMREFLLETAKYSVAFTLPILLFIGVFGDRILHLWMGEDYVAWSIIIILSMGYFLPISQSSTVRILVGLNAHGKAAIISIFVAFLSFLGGLFVLKQIGWTLENAAIFIAVSLTLSDGVVMPIMACRRMKIPLVTYVYKVFSMPLILGTVFFMSLLLCRLLFPDDYYQDMIWGAIIGACVILPMYWRWIASDVFRQKASAFVRRKLIGVFV